MTMPTSIQGRIHSLPQRHLHPIVEARRAICFRMGRIQVGGGGGGAVLRVPFLGTPKLHKEGKKRCACARKRRVSVLYSYPDPPPPPLSQNPVSAPDYPTTSATVLLPSSYFKMVLSNFKQVMLCIDMN